MARELHLNNHPGAHVLQIRNEETMNVIVSIYPLLICVKIIFILIINKKKIFLSGNGPGSRPFMTERTPSRGFCGR